VETIIQDIAHALSPFDEHEFLFNATGGTKIMALAATLLAEKYRSPMVYLESEGKQYNFYYHTWEDHRLISHKQPLEGSYLHLEDVFNLYLGPGKWEECGPDPKKDGAHFEGVLAEALRAHGYEVMLGVKGLNGQLDIDIAICFQNQFGIIEAKSDKNGKSWMGLNSYARL
jgi:hypothetical protein